jgi:hypothetical protein
MTIAEDIIAALESTPGVEQATLRERALIRAFAEQLFALEQRLYRVEEMAKTRPEWAR